MQEQNNVQLSWWVVITDKGEYRISEKEMGLLLEADKRGARFIMFDKVVLNIAFIKEAYKKSEVRNLEYSSVFGDEKYLVEEGKNKLLN